MKARVLHFVPSLDCVATTRQWILVCQHLVERGHPVRVVSLGGTGAMDAAARRCGAEVVSVNFLAGRPDGWFRELDRQLTDFCPDVVQTWTGSASIWGRLASLRRHVPRLIATCRTVARRPSPWTSWGERLLVRHTHGFVANCGAAAQWCLDSGIPASQLVLIRDGVPQVESATDDDRRRFRARLGLAADQRVVTFVGRLEAEQRVKDLLWAIDLLHAICEDTHLVVMGDGPHRWRLERFARQVHADQRTHFVGWAEQAPKDLAAADCLWLSSDRAGSPHSALEAMAAGVPVVAVDTPSIREVITHEETGLLVPVGDRGALARATNRVFHRADESKQRVEAAKQHVATRFSIAALHQQYDAFYEQILH